MFDSKAVVSSSNPSSLHLPTVPKPNRRYCRRSPVLSHNSMTSATTSTNVPDNVSALKEKYIDYAMWLKASSRQNREPMFTHELLKHSLCQMGIDTSQAEQLVSTCSWYVYQFQKELEVDTESQSASVPSENKSSKKVSKNRNKRSRSNKSRKDLPQREHSCESTTTITSINKENMTPSEISSLSTRNKFSVLPAIQSSQPSTSPRSRRVDFNNEQLTSQTIEKQKSSHWRSSLLKTRVLPKLRRSETESSTNNNHDTAPETPSADLDLLNYQKTHHHNVLSSSHHTRSILRKQISSSSSVASTEIDSRPHRNRILTPISTAIDEVPLGTRSQRLFGGSECFAQIMNELEQQTLH